MAMLLSTSRPSRGSGTIKSPSPAPVAGFVAKEGSLLGEDPELGSGSNRLPRSLLSKGTGDGEGTGGAGLSKVDSGTGECAQDAGLSAGCVVARLPCQRCRFGSGEPHMGRIEPPADLLPSWTSREQRNRSSHASSLHCATFLRPP